MTNQSEPPDPALSPDPALLRVFFAAKSKDSVTQQAPLTPLDEAYVAHADALLRLAHRALADFPLKPRIAHEIGGNLRDALELRRLADEMVAKAVVVERERGASWTEIGQAAEISKQSAHERWNHAVYAWTVLDRQHSSMHGSTVAARGMDAWYADLNAVYGREQYAITAGLASNDPRNIVEQQAADTNRTAARKLHQREEELRRKNTDAYEEAFAAIGTHSHAIARQHWADTHVERADAYDQLAEAEPTMADEHRRAAAKQRAIADEILRPTKRRDAEEEGEEQ